MTQEARDLAQQILDRYIPSERTHWDECWKEHTTCAMVRLALDNLSGGSGGGRAGQARVLPPRPASGQDGRETAQNRSHHVPD